MNAYLTRIRKPVILPVRHKIIYSIAILLFGIVLGLVAKVLDETASNVLPPFIETMDLRNFFSRMGFWLLSAVCIAVYSMTPWRAGLNVFLFFAGMVSSYYVYTIVVAGFFPKSYMMIWIIMTILSPLAGAICWYGRGTHPVSLGLSAVMIMMMERQTFSFGFWYVHVRYTLEALLLLLIIVVLYRTPKQLAIICAAGSLLFILTASIPLLGGML